MVPFWRRPRATSAAPAPAADATNTSLLDQSFEKRLSRLELVARHLQNRGDRGQRTRTRVGIGIEFAEHRPYMPGDDLRFVDFAAYARSGHLLVKQFAETEDLEVHIMLDCSASMGVAAGRKLRYAKQLAAAVGYVALSNLDRVSVHTFAADLGPRLLPLRGKRRALSLLRFLEQQEAAGATNLSASTRRFAARLPRRGPTVLITDGYDTSGLGSGVDALRYGGFDPVVLLVTDPEELSSLAHGRYTLVDAETGEQRAAHVTARTLRDLQRAREAQLNELCRLLREKEVRSFVLSVERPFDTALIEVLRRGGLWGRCSG